MITAVPPPWIYVATAEPSDPEMVQRIAAHRTRRGTGWSTLEVPRDLAQTLANHRSTPLLVDCLTLWLSNVLLAGADIDAEIDRLEFTLTGTTAPLVMVANEVGCGIVPDNALARRFRDAQGKLNQRIAARADRVVLVVAGLPLTIKGEP